MRALITGGAGFIGSHLSEALAQRETPGSRPRRPFDQFDRQHRAPQESLRVRVLHRLGRQRAAARRAHRQKRRRAPLRRRGWREAHRRATGTHDRNQRPRHRDRAQARKQEKEAGRAGLHLRGLRQERRCAVPGGLGSRAEGRRRSTAGPTRAARPSTSFWLSPTGTNTSFRSSSCGSSTRSVRGRPGGTEW